MKALARLLAACEDRCRDDAIDAAASLLGWLRKGGFMPSVAGLVDRLPYSLRHTFGDLV